MKICPKCGKTYPNDSTAFCFNDGVPLKAAPQESSPAEAEPAAEAAPEAAVPKDAGVPGAGLPGAGLPPAGASKRPRGGLFSAPSPLQALDAPLPAVSSHTLLPDDFEAEAPAAVQLGPHQLGSSLLATPQLLLFALADGRAAWVHPPDRPGRERFVKRVELARRGGDPSLLRVQDQGEHQGVAYAVVARPAGHDLASLMAGLRAKGIERLEAPYVWELGRALAGALAGLHRVQDGGVVGDLAPGRVFVDTEGRIQLLALVGPTPALPLNDELDRWARLAPEQCMRSESVDARADLFALGCLLWTLLTGRQHHLKSDRISTIKALAEGPPVDLASPLHALLARCMDPDPERRPQSAAALLDALKQIGQADQAHWGALIAQAFPAGSPALSGAELERVNGVLDILRGVAPLPQVPEHAPEMPDWPAPKAAPEPAVEPEAAPEPAAEPETPEPETPEPETPEPEVAEPEAASLTSSAPDVAEVEEPPESEDGGDDDSLAGGFFSDPAPSEPPPVAETPEPPITPQRSWGLPIAGALLGVLLLGAAGYLTWSSMQEEGGAPAGVPSAVQDAPKPPKVEPPPAPPVDEDQVQEEEDQTPSEPETTPPQDAQPTNTPAAPSTDEVTSAQTRRAQDSRASTTRSSGGSSRRGSTSETPAEPATTPNSGAALNTAGGTATDGRSIGSGARRGGGRAEEPKEDEGWEASPWGASQEQPASEQPASGGEDDNPWGEVE